MSNENIPNYQKLFGEVDFREGDEARSVYSPAAYLTDLLQLIDDEMKLSEDVGSDDYRARLDQRRKDIYETLYLNSENTFELLPYLDIVNERLEEKTASLSGQDAYQALKEAKYPFNLPFELEAERLKLYLKYLALSPEKLHKTFATEYEHKTVALGGLGLSENQWDFWAKELPGTEVQYLAALKELYGNKLEDIGESIRNVKVEDFLAATEISHLELQELLSQNLSEKELEGNVATGFFVNHELLGYAKIGLEDGDEEYLVWENVGGQSTSIPKEWYHRAFQFIRLAKATGISFTDLDVMLRTVCENNFDLVALKRIAVLKFIQDKFDQKVDILCSLFSGLNETGHGEEDEPMDVFDRVYNGQCAALDKVYVGDLALTPEQFDGYTRLEFSGDVLAMENKTYRERIAHGLGISEKQLQNMVRGFRSRVNEDIEDEDLHDRLWTEAGEESNMLSALHRTRKLMALLELSLEELFMLLDVLEKDPLVRKQMNSGVFLDFTIEERNAYSILRETGETQTDSVQNLLWLTQVLTGLSHWLSKNDLTAEELLKISSGLFPRDLKKTEEQMEGEQTKAQEMERKEKVSLLDQLYQGIKPNLLNDDSFMVGPFDGRFSRLVGRKMGEKSGQLVSPSDNRLVRFEEEAARMAAFEAVEEIDRFTRDDFLGLGIEEKIAEKIFNNLVLKGYIGTDGVLDEEKLAETSAAFKLETDFQEIQARLFDKISGLHGEFVDASVYTSDLEFLGLDTKEQDELYDNLIFNGYLSAEGTLLQSPTFESAEHQELFEVNSRIGVYSSQVFEGIQKKIKSFKSEKIMVTEGLFADLNLSEVEVEDLVENLRWNGYIDKEGLLTDNMALSKVDTETFLLALQFYPHRHGILEALQTHIKRARSKYYTFKKTFFLDVADELAADWTFDALSKTFMVEQRLDDESRKFFKELENAETLDVAWPFSSNDNRVVFQRVQSVITSADSYRFRLESLEALNFQETEIDELLELMEDSGFLDEDNKIPREKIGFFKNVDNALEFTLPNFEDYDKDVFFILHALAKNVDGAVTQILERHRLLGTEQMKTVYSVLGEGFGLKADVLEAISRRIFVGTEAVHEEWLTPVLETVSLKDQIERAPESSRFNTAYRRIRQFALLAAKLKLDKDEIEIIFHDQDLVEKFPEEIELPEITLADGRKKTIVGFDALLESEDGRVYLLKSADSDGNYARYWSYSSVTNELIETEDDKLSTLLSGDEDKTVTVSHVEAAFVDKNGNDVIIADGKYYYRKPMPSPAEQETMTEEEMKKPSPWLVREIEWGQGDTEFEELKVVEAAFTDEAGHSYLFSGDQFVRYSEGFKDAGGAPKNVDDEYPKDIVAGWPEEGPYGSLPEPFQGSLDAAFHGINDVTYFIKEGELVASDAPETIRRVSDVWGRVKNDLKKSRMVDATYEDGEQYFAISGEQVFGYRDCLENQELEILDGFPLSLEDHFSENETDKRLPAEFHKDVDAVFKGTDGKIRIFKDKKFTVKNLDGSFSAVEDIKDEWAKVENPLEQGVVNAAMAGLDGRVYLFSGDKYFRYSSSDYSQADPGFPRDVAKDWGGLTSINAAFVLDGKTYLFGTGDVKDSGGVVSTKKAYVRYSTSDYEEPDEDFPKQQLETDDYWWNLPEAVKAGQGFSQVDAVFNAPDGKTYLFSGSRFMYFDNVHRWWSEPKELSEYWQSAAFTAVDAAFSGKDGKTYIFSGDKFYRYSGDDYCDQDNGYPRPVAASWGKVKNNIIECEKVDGALVLESREEEEQDDGTYETKRTNHTYLFSGDQFVRYIDSDFTRVESAYPKPISELKEEPRFKELAKQEDFQAEIAKGLDAAFADQRNVYLFKKDRIQVLSDEICAVYPGATHAAFSGLDCAVMENGAVFTRHGSAWRHMSAAEGKSVMLSPENGVELPPLLLDAPEDYQNLSTAVLQGTDSSTYLFKAETYYNMQLNREYDIADQFGRVRNAIRESGRVDAAFVGRDGKTYVFSGDQYVVYEGASYAGQTVHRETEQSPAVRSIREDWGGLENVNIAYVQGDYTYLFEEQDAEGYIRYQRYSTVNYEKPDMNEPEMVDADFWGLPETWQDEGWDHFDAVILENNRQKGEETLLFIKDREFLQFNVEGEHWGEPQPLDKLWSGMRCEHHLFDDLEAAFVGADGVVYFFGDHCYATYNNGAYTQDHYIRDEWGIIPTNFTKVDAAFVHQGETTYLFSGNRFIRYSDGDYSRVDEGYPKSITAELRMEPGFENLPPEFEARAAQYNSGSDSVLIQGVVSNERNIYVFMGDDCYVSSAEKARAYGIDVLCRKRNVFSESGHIDAAFTLPAKEETYLFSGDQYIRYTGSKYEYVDEGYPKRIAGGLVTDLGINGGEWALMTEFYKNIDAALADKSGNVILFKNESFLDLNRAMVDSASEKTAAVKDYWGRATSAFFTGTTIDGAFVDSEGGLYVFKNGQFVRYADTEQDFIETGYPKPISSTFHQLPDQYKSGIDGAFTFAGRTYLIKEENGQPVQYVRYPGDNYACLSAPGEKKLYPAYFAERWGDWADYRIQDLNTIACFKDLQDSYGGDHTLVDVLRVDRGYAREPYEMLAEIFNWDVDEVKWLKRRNMFLPEQAPEERRFHLEQICRMFEILTLSEKLGAGVADVYEKIWLNLYDTPDEDSRRIAADYLLTLLGTRHCGGSNYEILEDEVHNKLNLLKRDALLAYVVFKDGLCDAREVYETLLIDVQMGECADTSRIKEAIAALQLYFHRYFINLEEIELKDADEEQRREDLKERWKWMRNYRVWEANRKVFLYPENYIRPELRDTKTPEFKVLEEDLQQGALTEANVTRAFQHYIDQYTEVSRLTIAGGYVYDDPQDAGDKNIVLFGRTKSEPRRYYYRFADFVGGRSDSAVWEPWMEVNVQIEADRVYPVYALNKIFVFWVVVETRSSVGANTNVSIKNDGDDGFTPESDAVTESVLQVYYTYFNLNREWAPPQKLNYELTSNDTITNYFLDFSAGKQDVDESLDHVKVSCHYTTEQEVKLKKNSDGILSGKDLLKLIERATDSDEGDVYLRASNDSEAYFLEHDALRDDDSNQDLPSEARPYYAKRVVLGDTLSSESKFRIVEALQGGDDLISFQAASLDDSYLLHSEDRALAMSKGDNDLFKEDASFSIVKGLIGEGYSFVSTSKPDYTLYYDDNKEVSFRKWNELTTLSSRRHASFKVIANRQEQRNSFRFYPETNSADEVREESVPGIPEGEISNSGIEIFKQLFPSENSSRVEIPVLLNIPQTDDSPTWVCFDYKGGSFLCKPTSGQTEDGVSGNLQNLPNGFGAPGAAFNANNKTYLFSGDQFLKADQATLMDEANSTLLTPENNRDVWGLINNPINSMDAALVWGGKSYLFSGQRFMVYSGHYDYVDDGYPRDIMGNVDFLPAGWDRLDAAFEVEGKTFFVRGDFYVTSDDRNLEKPIALLWAEALSPLDARAAFEVGGKSYVMDKSERLYEVTGSDFESRASAVYSLVTNMPDEKDIENGFFMDGTAYLQTKSGNKRVISSQNIHGLFVENKNLYTLETGANPGEYLIKGGNQSVSIEGVSSIDAFFFADDKIIMFSGAAYMELGLNKLKRKKKAGINWVATGTVSDYLETLTSGAPFRHIGAGINIGGDLYLISNHGLYMRYTNSELGSPVFESARSLSGNNDGLPDWDAVDAAFIGKDGALRFFHNDKYTDDFSFTVKDIRNDWAKTRNSIQDTGQVDAAFTLGEHAYLISGQQYYRYGLLGLDNVNGPDLEPGYPKKLSGNPDGLPSFAWGITDAFNLDNDKAYYFYTWGYYAEYNKAENKYRWGLQRDWSFPKGFKTFNAAYSVTGSSAELNGLYLIAGDKYFRYQDSSSDTVQGGDFSYDIIRLSSMTGSKLNQTLFVDGIDGLMKRSMQEIDELPRFVLEGELDSNRDWDSVIKVNPDRINGEAFPVDSHLEFRGANGTYYWELFYHAPSIIAASLNTAQKFEEAKRWYEYIFDPTEIGDYWKFLPFLAVDIGAVEAELETGLVGDLDEALANIPDTNPTPEQQELKGLLENAKVEVGELSGRLNPFGAALRGLDSMSGAEREDFNQLRKWDEDPGVFTTWSEVSALENRLKTLQEKSIGQELQERIRKTQEVLELIKRLPTRYDLMVSQGYEQIKTYLEDPFDPHAIGALRRIAYRRTTVMAYVDNLLDWGDMLFRQYTRESINEARMLYVLAYDLLGRKPENLGARALSDEKRYSDIAELGAEVEDNAYDFLFDVSMDGIEESSLTHAGLVHESVGQPYFYVPENSVLIKYWERVEDRLYKIRHCLNIMGIKQPLPLFQPPIDPLALVNAVAGGGGIGGALAGMMVTVPHYRFTFMLNKARELADKLNQFGNDLLGTIEKKDAEELSMLQNRQENVVLKLTRDIKDAQLSESKENLKNLEESKQNAEDQKDHYEDLLDTGMITAEEVQIGMMTTAAVIHTVSPVLRLAAAAVKVVPDVEVGSPFTMGATTGGSTLGAALGFIAESMESVAEGISMGGEVAGIYAQHQRSVEDWELQKQMAESEIKQLEYQIEGAKWQIRSSEQELVVHDKETEHNESISTFMKEKFSNEKLYLWMAGKLSALFFQTYKMAFDMSKSAEKAYAFERALPESQISFIGGGYWDSQKKGLLSGDSLSLDLTRMEKKYLETDARRFEVTKTISLLELDPMAFLKLKDKSVCEFDFSEEHFDYDFPGHYGRQIKSIALKISAGEGKTVNATLTQLRNKTVMEADVKAVKYLMNPKDEQPLTIRSDWRPTQQIAVSDVDRYTENSSGLFELSFGDERYLPFEGTGAVSRWRLELSGKKGSYNLSDLSDVEIEINYSAMQGGQAFADGVKGLLKPYPSAVSFDLATKFPNEFFAWVYGETEDLEITVTRDMFPNLSGSKVTGVYSYFEVEDEAQISLTMNDDSALNLRNNKMLLTNSLTVGRKGEIWKISAKGQKSKLKNVGLVFAYKANVE